MTFKIFPVLLLIASLFLACHQADPAKKNNKENKKGLSYCAEAEAAANNATSFAQSKLYLDAVNSIQTAFKKDSLEHAFSFGKNSNGNTIISAMTSGNGHSSSLEPVENMFADIHNHPKATPPSSGDLYGFIGLATESKQYQTRYIITAREEVYAFVLINQDAAKDFIAKYPKVNNPGYQPGFPDSLVDEFNRYRYVHSVADEIAMAFILKKYNAGIVLLKQNDKEAFNCIETVQAVDKNN